MDRHRRHTRAPIKQSHKKFINLHRDSKNCATIHSFITPPNVGRFSKFFHCCILKEIFNKTHANMSHPPMCNCTTLWKLKFKIQPQQQKSALEATYRDESRSKCSPALQPSSSSAKDERQTYCTEPVKWHQKEKIHILFAYNFVNRHISTVRFIARCWPHS